MASPITKRTGVDNFDSAIPGTVEVWYFSKKCWIEHKTGKVVKNEGVPENAQAFKVGVEIAKEMR